MVDQLFLSKVGREKSVGNATHNQPHATNKKGVFRRRFVAWQGLKESNPHQRFWRPLFYH